MSINTPVKLQQNPSIQLWQEDATHLSSLSPNSIDSLICDPPSGIGYWEWDGEKGGRDAWIAWLASIMREAYRVLKPGGHGFVWATPRRSHWTAMALEDADFQIRDRFTHISANGMPRSHKQHGEWEGWQTHLKPAVDDWWLVRKPMISDATSENLARFGTGALNIDACRIPVDGKELAEGRHATNLLLSHHIECCEQCVPECPVAVLNQQSGEECGSVLRPHHQIKSIQGRHVTSHVLTDNPFGHGDTGGASRFFMQFQPEEEYEPFLYMSRPAPAERHAGCEHLPQKNNHPSVKPVAMMLYFIRLVTQPGGIVLDPFMGSGTTGVAAVQGGFGFLGIEQDAHNMEIAQARITHALQKAKSNT